MQLAYARWPLLYQHLYGGCVAECGAGRECIPAVQFR
jgi:hypothetical protein